MGSHPSVCSDDTLCTLPLFLNPAWPSTTWSLDERSQEIQRTQERTHILCFSWRDDSGGAVLTPTGLGAEQSGVHSSSLTRVTEFI